MLSLLSRSAIKMAKPTTFQNMMAIRHFAIVSKFTKSHEWITFDTDTGLAKIGITDHAQHELGDIVHVDLPEIGNKYEKLDTIIAVESVKTAADVYCMVDGEVVAVNENLHDDSSLVNSSAQENGWMVEIKVTKPSQLDALLSHAEY